MTTTNTGNVSPPDPELQPAMTRIDPYAEWRNAEEAHKEGGVYIRNMFTLPVGPWPRKGDGVKGTLIYMDGEDHLDTHLVELPPGGQTAPDRHMYTGATYVLEGRGSATVWYEGGAKQTFEFGPGAYFVLPTNASYQIFNGSISQPLRYFSVTDLPELMRRWVSSDFVWANPFEFKDRFSQEQEYFNAEAMLWKGRVWETNFIPDIYKLPMYEWKSRGGGGTNAFMVMGSGTMENHISTFQPGYYKKAHRHDSGAHLYITEGEGFVLMQRGADEERMKCEWQKGSLYLSGAGKGLWLHQHFNVGETQATYLVLNQGLSRKYAKDRWTANLSTVLRTGEVSNKEGGLQVEYEDENPEIHAIFEEELRKRGLVCRMKNMSPYCTGEAGLTAARANMPTVDEH